MKRHKKHLLPVLLLVGLGIAGAIALADPPVWWIAITDVYITSPNDGDTVYAGGSFAATCTTSTDKDCDWSEDEELVDTVVHSWSTTAGSFSPETGTSVTWTAPLVTGDANITVTADDVPDWADDTAKTHTHTVTVTNIIYVDANATGRNDGSSWSHAFIYLQDALDAADDANVNDNEIWVAEGTYYPDEGDDETNDLRTETFGLVANIAVYGGFEGNEVLRSERDWPNHVTILSGDIDKDSTPDGDNSYNVVVGAAGATLDGFTVTNGYADHGSTAQYQCGGGMYNSSVSPTVENCIFTDNAAFFGGGMHNTSASPTVTDCSFVTNTAALRGGGMDNVSSSPTVTNCVFDENTANGSDPNYVHGGGGMCCYQSDPTIDHCIFKDNNATNLHGGGIYFYDCNYPEIESCTFSQNSADNGQGGAILFNDHCSAGINNSILYGNTDSDGAGDIYVANYSGLYIYYSCYGVLEFDGTSSVYYSGLIQTDPLFGVPASDDFHLKSEEGRWDGDEWVTDGVTSPCIDTGDPGSGYANEPTPNGSRINMGVYGNTSEASKTP